MQKVFGCPDPLVYDIEREMTCSGTIDNRKQRIGREIGNVSS